MTQTERETYILKFLEKKCRAVVQDSGDLEADGIGADINCCEFQYDVYKVTMLIFQLLVKVPGSSWR